MSAMKKRIFTVIAAATVIVLTAVPALAADATTVNPFVIDWSGVDFNPVIEGITTALPFIIVPVIGFIGLRKGIQFVRGMLKGA
jgi:hypothetical protein